MGSASDEPVVNETVKTLEQMGIDYEVRVMSAHRTPERVAEYAQQARDRGIQVLMRLLGGRLGRRRCRLVMPVTDSWLRGSDGIDGCGPRQMPGGIRRGHAVGAWGPETPHFSQPNPRTATP